MAKAKTPRIPKPKATKNVLQMPDNTKPGNGFSPIDLESEIRVRAYELYEQKFATQRWQALASAGAHPQRPLWASTGTKDPAYDDTRYVTGLVAPSVINTMPEATLNAVADHGDIPADSIHGTYEQSQAVLDDLAALGIGYDDVVQTLEDQGVTAFDASWDHLGQRLATALGTPGR